MKSSQKRISAIIFTVVLTLVLCFNMSTIAFAASADEISSQADFTMTDGCFDNYTDSDYYYNRGTGTQDTSKSIKDYPDYFFQRFYGYYNLTDEWILGFVPEELFIYEGEYFYIGQQNGFFVDNFSTFFILPAPINLSFSS